MNALFPVLRLAPAGRTDMIRPVFNGWGAVRMPKRFWAFLYGTEDAVPGDYVLALIATVGLMAAILMGMI